MVVGVLDWVEKLTMSNITAAVIANRNKKHFLGVPAPLGYVAGVGRG